MKKKAYQGPETNLCLGPYSLLLGAGLVIYKKKKYTPGRRVPSIVVVTSRWVVVAVRYL